MSAANVLSIARSRAFSDFVFPLKFKMTTSSGKMTIAPQKLSLYLQRQPLKTFENEIEINDTAKQEINEIMKVFSDPEIFEDEKPRFSVGACYNAETKETKLICYMFVKSGKGIKITHQLLSCEDKIYPNKWYFLINFSDGKSILSISKHGISDEDISNILGSGISHLVKNTAIPELSNALSDNHEL
jgi:hypothetical protein